MRNAVTVGHYAAFIRRQAPSIVGCMLAGVTLSGWWLQQRAVTYTATVRILASSMPAEFETAGVTSSSRPTTMDTEAKILRSQPVAQLAAAALHVSPSDLESHVAVIVPDASRLLLVAFRATTPTGAQSGANAVATAYLHVRLRLAHTLVHRRLEDLRALAGRLHSALVESAPATPAVATAAGSGHYLTTALQAVTATIDSTIRRPVDPGRVVASAARPRRPDHGNRSVVVANGLMCGLLAGVGIGRWRERRT